MKVWLQIVSLIAAFLAGFLIRGIGVDKNTPALQIESEKQPKIGGNAIAESPPAREPDRLHPRDEATAKGYLKLDAKVVEGLLSGGDASMKLHRMGLDEEQTKAIREIQKKSQSELKRIEKAHARQRSDGQGEYVEVAAFPEDREKWLAETADQAREVLGDDRAEVVARIIAFEGNDWEVGLYRREIFVTPAEQDGKSRIEEKVFDRDGKHIDSDYELVDPNSAGRWGHLLEAAER